MAIESEKVHAWLGAALRTAFVQDNVLFLENTHERSIVFHIARHLATIVQDELPGYAVDVDYDRWHVMEFGYIKKALYGLSENDGEQLEYGEDVYPDVIIHRRTGSSAGHNVLVVEAKKRQGRHLRDRRKLQLFQEQLKYQHAVFVVLGNGVDPPVWDWISEPGTGMQPVFQV